VETTISELAEDMVGVDMAFDGSSYCLCESDKVAM